MCVAPLTRVPLPLPTGDSVRAYARYATGVREASSIGYPSLSAGKIPGRESLFAESL